MKRTPISRPDGAELVRRISSETEGLPPTRLPAPREPDPPKSLPSATPQHFKQSTATEQINFRGSSGLARLLARLAVEQGSIRLAIARLLADAGHEVPEVDLQPPPGRRRLG